MVWYKKPEVLPAAIDYISKGGEQAMPHYQFDISTLEESDRAVIGNQLTLVRVDTPHNIIVRDNARLVISLRFGFDNFTTWEQAVDFFEKFIIE
jgi:hypothetical protein